MVIALKLPDIVVAMEKHAARQGQGLLPLIHVVEEQSSVLPTTLELPPLQKRARFQ
jgi:hypothetical protein